MNFFPEWENVYIMFKKKCEIDTLEIMKTKKWFQLIIPKKNNIIKLKHDNFCTISKQKHSLPFSTFMLVLLSNTKWMEDLFIGKVFCIQFIYMEKYIYKISPFFY